MEALIRAELRKRRNVPEIGADGRATGGKVKIRTDELVAKAFVAALLERRAWAWTLAMERMWPVVKELVIHEGFDFASIARDAVQSLSEDDANAVLASDIGEGAEVIDLTQIMRRIAARARLDAEADEETDGVSVHRSNGADSADY